jgi:hypothetical protein
MKCAECVETKMLKLEIFRSLALVSNDVHPGLTLHKLEGVIAGYSVLFTRYTRTPKFDILRGGRLFV